MRIVFMRFAPLQNDNVADCANLWGDSKSKN